MRRNAFLFLFFFGMMQSISCIAQQDSVEVFFIGNTPGEKFKVFWDGKLIISFKGNRSYKHKFKVPRDETWMVKGYTGKFSVYRKPFFGLGYKEIGTFNPSYEHEKYLIIWRNPKLKNRAAIQTRWSKKEPLHIPDI